MPRFGRNHFPRSFGGRPRTTETEHRALLDALKPYGYDVSEGSPVYVETYAQARLSEAIWAVNARAKNQEIPSRMQEFLPVYEAACRLRPEPGETLQARRRAVAGKLRGVAGNSTGDVYDAVRALAGVAFVDVQTVPEEEEWAYYPGGTPGPPGFEWMSNRAQYIVMLDDKRVTEEEYASLIAKTADMLTRLIRTDMTYTIGVAEEGGFRADIGRADITLVLE